MIFLPSVSAGRSELVFQQITAFLLEAKRTEVNNFVWFCFDMIFGSDLWRERTANILMPYPMGTSAALPLKVVFFFFK